MIIQNQEPASPVAAIQEELVLDTADFDIFSSLDDLKVESKVVKTQPENVIEDDVAQDEATEDADEFEEEGFDFSDLDDDDVNDYSENDGYEKDEVEEEELDEEVEYEDEEGEEVEADDGFEEEEVEYDGYMVNLPDGSEVNLADAVQGYRNAEAVRELQEHFTSQKEAFVEEAKNLMSHMELAKLEADRVIDDYDNFDWVKLSQEDPQKYVDNREFLDKYKVRRSEIQSAMNDINETKQANEEAAFTATAQACVTELKADIPGWNDDLYGDLMSYAVDNGASEDEMSRIGTLEP